MNRKTAVVMIACSKAGSALMHRLGEYMTAEGICGRDELICLDKCRALEDTNESESIVELTGKYYHQAGTIIYIAATGIAVRSIAPYIGHKSQDPAVVAIDAYGNYCIPLLSGHAGGANRLAERLAEAIGATAVITTATDVKGCFAVDEFAREYGLIVSDWDIAKRISAELINDNEITYMIKVTNRLPRDCDSDRTLRLIPRDIVAGIGCKRGTDRIRIQNAIRSCFSENGIDNRALCAVASIYLKKDERGIIDFCNIEGVPFETYTEEELLGLYGEYTESDFVQSVTGIDCVCERSAVMCAGGLPDSLICRKSVYDGVTVALAGKESGIDYEAAICGWNRTRRN